MSEDPTHQFTPFEAMVLQRFDQIDIRFDKVDIRFDQVEQELATVRDEMRERLEKLEAMAIDTKPIWERALSEILEIKDQIAKIDRKFSVLATDMVELRSDQERIERRIDLLEERKPV
jgi:archaellum component FlaC